MPTTSVTTSELLPAKAGGLSLTPCRGGERWGVRLRDRTVSSRVIKLSADFYALALGNEALQPPQATPIEGQTLRR